MQGPITRPKVETRKIPFFSIILYTSPFHIWKFETNLSGSYEELNSEFGRTDGRVQRIMPPTIIGGIKHLWQCMLVIAIMLSHPRWLHEYSYTKLYQETMETLAYSANWISRSHLKVLIITAKRKGFILSFYSHFQNKKNTCPSSTKYQQNLPLTFKHVFALKPGGVTRLLKLTLPYV